VLAGGLTPGLTRKPLKSPGSLSALISLRWAHDCARQADSPPGAPSDAELLAFEAGCEDYCEREVDDYLASSWGLWDVGYEVPHRCP
jgi:hypothetical protein